jgi:tellurite methyltransferase
MTRTAPWQPALLVRQWADLLVSESQFNPILDLACGDGHNGLYLAFQGLHVVFYDRSEESLRLVRQAGHTAHLTLETRQIDLEVEGANPLPEERFSAVLVLRYLHRPLIPCIRKSLRDGGILIYETFTLDQRQFGKPNNPNFLLSPGELKQWFEDWDILHSFEGLIEDPLRAVAQIVCRKPMPGTRGS